jgi:hypothetical protein
MCVFFLFFFLGRDASDAAGLPPFGFECTPSGASAGESSPVVGVAGPDAAGLPPSGAEHTPRHVVGAVAGPDAAGLPPSGAEYTSRGASDAALACRRPESNVLPVVRQLGSHHPSWEWPVRMRLACRRPEPNILQDPSWEWPVRMLLACRRPEPNILQGVRRMLLACRRPESNVLPVLRPLGSHHPSWEWPVWMLLACRRPEPNIPQDPSWEWPVRMLLACRRPEPNILQDLSWEWPVWMLLACRRPEPNILQDPSWEWPVRMLLACRRPETNTLQDPSWERPVRMLLACRRLEPNILQDRGVAGPDAAGLPPSRVEYTPRGASDGESSPVVGRDAPDAAGLPPSGVESREWPVWMLLACRRPESNILPGVRPLGNHHPLWDGALRMLLACRRPESNILPVVRPLGSHHPLWEWPIRMLLAWDLGLDNTPLADTAGVRFLRTASGEFMHTAGRALVHFKYAENGFRSAWTCYVVPKFAHEFLLGTDYLHAFGLCSPRLSHVLPDGRGRVWSKSVSPMREVTQEANAFAGRLASSNPALSKRRSNPAGWLKGNSSVPSDRQSDLAGRSVSSSPVLGERQDTLGTVMEPDPIVVVSLRARVPGETEMSRIGQDTLGPVFLERRRWRGM